MYLHQLEKPKGSTKKRKRVGRGPGSGRGKTSGRGQKGQKSRSGGSIKRGFEGGQMPLYRRLPKFGFTNLFRTTYQIINLESLNKIENEDHLTKEILLKNGLIKSLKKPVKLLGEGNIQHSFQIEVEKASNSAIQKIEQSGGQVILLN